MKIRKLLAAAVAMATIGAWNAADAAILNALPSQDTWVGYYNAESPNLNFSGNNLLDIQGPIKDSRGQRGLLQYDLASIPTGSTVTSAILRIHNHVRNGTVAHDWEVREIVAGNEWDAATATWRTRNGTDAWAGGMGGPLGGAQSDAGHALGPVARASVNLGIGSQSALDLDLTGLVQEWVDGTIPNLGIGIQSATIIGSSTVNENWTIYTAGHANTTVNPPELIITYTPIPEPSILGFAVAVFGASLLRHGRRS